ncbi:MAG: signal recognition particle-docking protein FtsY [Chloroflexi bacterium]|nr:signal recognition particle-docking protein FtsY [Chloroflexota bacterium]
MFGLFKKTDDAVKRTRETWFSRVSGVFNRTTVDESLWEELEELLICADVGSPTTDLLIQRVKERARREHINQADGLRSALKEEMVAILDINGRRDAILAASVLLVVGANGVGKTTSIAKLANHLQSSGKKVVLAAADTFRAAAIDQLKLWGERTGTEVIAHQPGADPGAVVFDALQAARNRQADTVIVDTAGRLHTKHNLMEELKKIRRVISRVEADASVGVLLVMDAVTGQNGLSQARYFAEATGVDGILLAKLDGTAKGGIVLAICHELNIPIVFIGTGEKLDDLAPFDAAEFGEALFAS